MYFTSFDPKSGKWYHIDARYRVWGCSRMEPLEKQVSLCLAIDELLKRKGELQALEREIAIKRKQLGLKVGDPMTE